MERVMAAAEKAEEGTKDSQTTQKNTLDIQELRELISGLDDHLVRDGTDTTSSPYFDPPHTHKNISTTKLFNSASSLNSRHPRVTDLLAWVLQDADVEGAECYTYIECRRIIQLVKERKRRMEVLWEVKSQIVCNFSGSELAELKLTYRELQKKDIGKKCLGKQQIRQVMLSLNFDVRQAIFDAAFETLDVDGSGSMDFGEFMRLVRMIQGDTNADEAVEVLHDLTPLELRVLVDNLGVPPANSDKMSVEELVEKAFLVLGVDPRSPLKKTIGVSTVGELHAYARRIGHPLTPREPTEDVEAVDSPRSANYAT